MQECAHILVVDDEEEIVAELRDLLESQGYKCTGAMQAEAGLEVLCSSPVDLIIVDLKMPGMDGYGFIKSLATTPWRNVPCVVTTGHGTVNDIKRLRTLGVHTVVTKPMDPKKFCSTVDAVLPSRT